MARHDLAIFGGKPVRTAPFPAYNPLGPEEKRAVAEVLDSGNLSQFLGTWSADFHGGPRVQALERAWAERFGVKHAVSVNSATSGLFAAIGAAGVGPGDEVVVSPYTMSASAVGPLVYGATPVFADIDPRTYCITAETVEPVLTPRTRALIAVDLFGHPADFGALRDLAEDRDLLLIEDAAQAAGARDRGRWAGTLGDVGVFSLNYHKIIHAGEGGVVVTDDERLAQRVRLIRNHAEAVVAGMPGDVGDLADLVGFNYRMTEIEAAIAAEQLRKLDRLVEQRIHAAETLRARIAKVPGLTPAEVLPGRRHVYYALPVQTDAAVLGASRDAFVRAVVAEGVPLSQGYVQPLYLQPLYQRGGAARWARLAPGASVSYAKGLCPVAESMHFERLFYTSLVHPGLSEEDLDDVATAVEKVAAAAAELRPTTAGHGVPRQPKTPEG